MKARPAMRVKMEWAAKESRCIGGCTSWRANVDSSARINGRNIDLRRETMENGLFTNSIDVIDQKHFIGPKKEAEAASCGWK